MTNINEDIRNLNKANLENIKNLIDCYYNDEKSKLMSRRELYMAKINSSKTSLAISAGCSDVMNDTKDHVDIIYGSFVEIKNIDYKLDALEKTYELIKIK